MVALSASSLTFRWSEFYKSREIISEARLVCSRFRNWNLELGNDGKTCPSQKNRLPTDFCCWIDFFWLKTVALKWTKIHGEFEYYVQFHLVSSYPQGGVSIRPWQCFNLWVCSSQLDKSIHRFCSRNEPSLVAHPPKLKRFSCNVGGMGTLGVI